MTQLGSLPVGSVFGGDYRVLARIGEGGMGEVYQVEQISTQRQRALKVMHPSVVARPDLRARFELEARVGARINSEHVVDVLEASVDPASGAPYLVMELLAGETLGARVRTRGSLPPSELLAIFAQLCEALSKAHAVGVVHRDLKPENIFLRAPPRGMAVFVKLLDFGISKVVNEATDGGNTEALGTPMFMAPEQMTGGRVSPATDVWALGLIAFHALSGRPYWRSLSQPDSSAMRLMHEVGYEPQAPATRRAGELGSAAELPVGFDAWFARCTERAPERRFADAGQAFAALEAAFGVAPGAHPAAMVPHNPFLPAPPRPHGAAALGLADTASAGPLAVSDAMPLAPHPRRSAAPVLVAIAALVSVVVAGGAGLLLSRIPGSPRVVSSGPAPRPVDLYRKACDAGNGPGCGELGHLYARGEGVPKDLLEAARLYQLGCSQGSASACADSGYAFENGRGVPKDDARAAALYKQACDGGNLTGCTNLGVALEAGRGVPKDEPRALEIYRTACAKGFATGCGDAGWALQHGHGAPKDEVAALALMERGCDGGDARSCTNLGYAYEYGQGTAKDDARAVPLYKKGCDRGNSAGCTDLGYMYEKGRAVPVDKAKAEALYKQGCDGGNATGCTNLGKLIGSGQGAAGVQGR